MSNKQKVIKFLKDNAHDIDVVLYRELTASNYKVYGMYDVSFVTESIGKEIIQELSLITLPMYMHSAGRGYHGHTMYVLPENIHRY